MTLDELVDLVCTKTEQVEEDDRAAARLFLSKRYELIYNTYLWKEALTMVSVPVDPVNDMDNAAGIVALPQQIDRVVAIRTSEQSVRIKALEDFYRVDWNRFVDTGLPQSEFAILDAVWLSIKPINQPVTPPTSSTQVVTLTVPIGQQIFSGHYAGEAPGFTPDVTDAIATDLDEPHKQWTFYGGEWHL
jgi:hypothetical protein